MIAEQIYAGMEMQQGKYNALADNLIGLGRNIVGSLQMQAAQKQVQQALPLMQSAYSQAMDKIQAGQVTEGYRDALNAQLQFGSIQNPFIAQMNQMAGDVFTNVLDAEMRKLQIKSQYGGRGVSDETSPGRGASLLDIYTGTADENQVDANVGGLRDILDQEAVDQLPEQETSFSAGTTGNWSFQMGGYKKPSKEIETTANQEFEKYSQGDELEQESYRTSVMSPQVPRGTEFVEQPGLNRFKGFERVTGVFIPKEATIDYPEYTVRKDERGRLSETLAFKKKTINESQKTKSNELAYTDLPTAIARISENQSLEKYFLENNPEALDIGSRKDINDQPTYFIGVRGKKDSYMPIEKDDYLAATLIRRLPSTSKTYGSALAITEAEPTEAPAAPADVDAQAEQIFGVTTPTKETPTAAAAKPTTELTLEERIAAKTTTAAPTRTATREQIAGVKAGQVRQQRSTLESEKTRLERSLYETPRAGGGRKLKRGLTAQDPDVKAALDRITAINKQLEAL